jgi:hypothetical protein
MRRAVPGQPLRIPASDYNAFVAAAEAHKARRFDAPLVAQPSPVAPSGPTILLLNDSGADQDRFAVLGISGFVIEPSANLAQFQGRVALTGVLPIAEGEEGEGEQHTEDTFAVLAEPIKDSKIGRAWVHGACPVQVDVTDAAHRYARIIDGDSTMLQSADSGPVAMLWKETGTGTKWAVIRWGGSAVRAVFPVALQQVGGVNGDEDSIATWTYDVKDPVTDDTLASAVNPTASPHKWVRPSVGLMHVATFGYAHYQSDGEGGRELVLGWINEHPVVDACEG